MTRHVGVRALVLALTILLSVSSNVFAQNPPEAQRFTAGDRARLLAFSPDGTMVAGKDGDRLCAFAVPSGDEISCADVRALKISVDEESVTWAPGSTSFVFSEPAFRSMDDADIWHFDARSGELADLTDDGYQGTIPIWGQDSVDHDIYVDVAPAWSPDGRSIAFSRTIVSPGADATPNELWMLDLATGETTTIATLDPEEMGTLTYGLIWSPDSATLYASLSYEDSDNPGNGIHAINVATGDDRLIAGPTKSFGRDVPRAISISPDGETLIVVFPDYVKTSLMNHLSGYVLMSVDDGSVTRFDTSDESDPRAEVVMTPVFTAAGDALVYVIAQGTERSGVMVSRDIASGDETVVATLPAGVMPLPVWTAHTMVIGANGIALIQVNPFEAYLAPVADVQN